MKSRRLLQSDLVAPITIVFYLVLLLNRILFLLRVVTQKLNFLASPAARRSQLPKFSVHASRGTVC